MNQLFIFYTIISLLLVTIIVLIVYLIKRLKEVKESENPLVSSIQENLKIIHERLDRSHSELRSHITGFAQLASSLGKDIGSFQELGRQIKDFQEMLKAPKFRGEIGESILKDLISQCLPKENFDFQYRFKNGFAVDAVIKTDKGLIPIDSKFPLENFKKYLKEEDDALRQKIKKEFIKDIKEHIEDIAKKYIEPQEGTVNFALMYVPNESIYYELIREGDQIPKFAYDKKILIVSPNSFYYFLRIIMFALEGKKIEKTAQQILEILSQTRIDSEKLKQALLKLNKHFQNAQNTLVEVNQGYSRLTAGLDKIKYLKSGK